MLALQVIRDAVTDVSLILKQSPMPFSNAPCLRCRNLPAADWTTGQCDPYVTLSLVSTKQPRKQARQVKQTKVIESNRFPVRDSIRDTPPDIACTPSC